MQISYLSHLDICQLHNPQSRFGEELLGCDTACGWELKEATAKEVCKQGRCSFPGEAVSSKDVFAKGKVKLFQKNAVIAFQAWDKDTCNTVVGNDLKHKLCMSYVMCSLMLVKNSTNICWIHCNIGKKVSAIKNKNVKKTTNT